MQGDFMKSRFSLLIASVAIFTATCFAQSGVFAPLGQWEDAIRSGNPVVLQALYSTTPPAQIGAGSATLDAKGDTAFWTGLKVRALKTTIVQSESPAPGSRQLVLQVEVTSAGPAKHTVYITEGQLWQDQGGTWKIVAAKRTDATRLQQPTSTGKDIYKPGADAKSEIKEALESASKSHKRVLLVFGANWCYDCHVLDLAFHRPDLAPVVDKNYEVVHVDVGEYDKNLDLMEKYDVPKKKGIPGVAVLDSSGKLLYSQTNGEFEKARSLAPEDLLAFLNKWKPTVR
jgi:thioredoxin 1